MNDILAKEDSYVNLERLKIRLEKGKLDTNLAGLIDRQRLVADLKAKPNLIPGFFAKFEQTPIDVLSLDEARTMVELDNSLPQASKAHALEVIDHIANSALTVSNEQRKATTIGQYLSGSHDKFAKFASNLLE